MPSNFASAPRITSVSVASIRQTIAFHLGLLSRSCLRCNLLAILYTMRPLTEPETKTLFEKLASYTGRSLSHLISPPDSEGSKTNERYVFRVQNSRVYYVREVSGPRVSPFGIALLLTYVITVHSKPCDFHCTSESPFPWYLSWKIHKDRQIQGAHHGAECDCAPCSL